jgi:hypothetical protein
VLEDAFIPQEKDIVSAIQEMASGS